MLLEELVLPLRTDHSAFKAGIAFAAASVAALVAGMGLAIKATFKWADELDSIQDIMGVTNKTAAALNFTLRKSGTSTEALTKGMTILSKGLIKADGSLDTTGKSLKAWGINVLDANGMLKDQTTLIGEISEKYASFGTQQEKVNFLTETFGRSGAELIDFFDTLANDGGIDAVAAKIERLGLAIDPNRYEQFNRNLEELKLVGLALAVGFTEKVMPAIEKFLEIISDPNLTVSSFAAKADKFIGGLIDNMAGSIDNWVSGGGPEALSENLISWIEGIGDSSFTKSKIQIAMEHLVASMGEALSNVDWSGVWAAIDAKLDELDAVMTPAIRESLDNIDATFNEWLANDFWNEVLRIDAILAEGNRTAMENFATNFKAGLQTVIAQGSVQLQQLGAIFTKWAASVLATYNTWAAGVNATVNTALITLKTTIENKLTDIAKTFYNRCAGWAAQAAKGFEAGVGAILSVIQGIVGEINSILKGIQTSFSIGFTYSVPTLGGASGTSNLGGGSTGGGGGNKKRASGGPVIAGQNYSVAEFFRPEVFTPNTNGRVDPMQPQNVTATIDEGRLARVIVQALMQAGYNG